MGSSILKPNTPWDIDPSLHPTVLGMGGVTETRDAVVTWAAGQGDALCMGGFDKKPEELWGALPCFRVRLLGRCQEDEDEEEDPLKSFYRM